MYRSKTGRKYRESDVRRVEPLVSDYAGPAWVAEAYEAVPEGSSYDGDDPAYIMDRTGRTIALVPGRDPRPID